MLEKFPILLKDLEVGTVVIQNRHDAVKAATDAAYNISSSKDAQLCPFSDGSYRPKSGRGGVGVVCRRQWLPDGWTSDQTGTNPNGDLFKQAWAYKYTPGILEMEGIGVLEGIHVANKTIARDLDVLKAHNCTVTVRVTTDCDLMLRHIANKRSTKYIDESTVSLQLIKNIKEELQMLQGHGIKVIAELHWCPRNRVAQLIVADQLAHEAMKRGLGYCNATQGMWSKDIKSDMALDIETLAAGGVSVLPAELPNNTTKMSRKARKRARRRARQAESIATPTNDSEPQPQLPLPELSPPSKPGKSTPLQTPLQCWHDWWFSPPWDGDKRD